MKSALWWMLAAAVLVWAGVLLDVGRAPAPRGASAPAETATSSDATAQAGVTPRARPSREREQAPGETANPRDQGTRPAMHAAIKPPPPGRGDVQVIGAKLASPRVAGALPAARPAPAQGPAAFDESMLGEQGEGVFAPEYVELEGTYAAEGRVAEWALPEEQRIEALLRASPMRDQVALVNCMDTTCRIVIEADTNDAFERLLQVRGLAEATGLHAGTPFSLRSGQLSVYLRRR